ncbi:zinc-dependent peptidase [bacterium]|nr:zinc-dependent peptidase [bacterium]
MSSPISGLNMGMYDASYLTAVQREIARSVKTNSLKDLDDDVATALLLTTTDEVNLSPEAKAYLQKLRQKLRKKRQDDDIEDYSKPDERDFSALLQGLEDFRDQPPEEEKPKLESKPLFPSTIMLSDHVPSAPRPKTKAYSPTRETIDRMIYFSPTQTARAKLQDELEPLGFEIISNVKAFGVKVIIMERNVRLSQIRIHNIAIVHPSERTFDGRPWDMVRGIYDSSRRLFVIGEEQLGNPNHSVGRHEFAHAFDHAFSETHQRRLPLSVQLWNLFRKDRTGLVSSYAATNPAEYFAESVDAFFIPAKRQKLQEQDPKMFAYLRELFELA